MERYFNLLPKYHFYYNPHQEIFHQKLDELPKINKNIIKDSSLFVDKCNDIEILHVPLYK